MTTPEEDKHDMSSPPELTEEETLINTTGRDEASPLKVSTSEEDDSAVLVNHKDAEDEQPRALQIVSIGTEEDSFAFTYHKERLATIIQRIPSGTKVAVISVVGAFRTGKSFLLSFFLRYLHYLQQQERDTGNDESSMGNKHWYDKTDTLGNDGFHWRAGEERDTTGIWMWSHPNLIQNLAVLLVDTQGMFDNETTMILTTSIFGLSTLLSSYQIFNVDKKIGEDSLQQLALFSEYARSAMVKATAGQIEKPFQRMEFLVRDWQNFEDNENCDDMVRRMEAYLDKVMAERAARDLQGTRDQINLCFSKITCFGLTHPGMDVPKKSYAGEISKIDKTFLQLLDVYCSRVFDNLEAKKLHGQELTGEELATYIEHYVKMFASGATLPEPTTLLEATTAANNTNAVNLAFQTYKEFMDRIAGPKCSNYVKANELASEHENHVKQSLDVFQSRANFGSETSINRSKRELLKKIKSDFEMYEKLNDSRNPVKDLEIWLIPGGIGVVSYVVGKILDGTCAHHVCRASSDALWHSLAVVMCFVFIVIVTKFQQVAEKTKAVLDLLGLLPKPKPKQD